MSSRRRNIDEELAELGVNIARGGRPIANTCQDTAQKLRHVLGRRSDETPLGRAGLDKAESDHLLARLARRGDRGALIVAAASFQLIANLALDLATVLNLHIVHQEHAARHREAQREDNRDSGDKRSPEDDRSLMQTVLDKTRRDLARPGEVRGQRRVPEWLVHGHHVHRRLLQGQSRRSAGSRSSPPTGQRLGDDVFQAEDALSLMQHDVIVQDDKMTEFEEAYGAHQSKICGSCPGWVDLQRRCEPAVCSKANC